MDFLLITGISWGILLTLAGFVNTIMKQRPADALFTIGAALMATVSYGFYVQ